MAAEQNIIVLVVSVLLFCATEGDNTNGNLITARVEVSVVLLCFKQSVNINVYSYLIWKFVGLDVKQTYVY
jgi:hypothetical protein